MCFIKLLYHSFQIFDAKENKINIFKKLLFSCNNVTLIKRRHNLVVKCVLPKHNSRVRFPLPAPKNKARFTNYRKSCPLFFLFCLYFLDNFQSFSFILNYLFFSASDLAKSVILSLDFRLIQKFPHFLFNCNAFS